MRGKAMVLPDVQLQAAHPGRESLHAHAEARVRNRAILAQIQVPLERLPRKIVIRQAL